MQVHGGSGFWSRVCSHPPGNCTGVNCTQAVVGLNVTFFQREDAFYAAAEETGLVLVVGRLVGDLLARSPHAHRVLPKLFAYMTARWGAFPVTFLFTQEYNVLYYGPTNVSLLMEQGEVVRDADPWKRALTMHPAVLWKDTRDAWTRPWYDFVMIQEGHLVSTSGSTLRAVRDAAEGMPCVNGEANYEGFRRQHKKPSTNPTTTTTTTTNAIATITNNITTKNATSALNCSAQVNAACVRDSAWITMQSGFAGFTYGAQGLYACVQNASEPGPTGRHGPVLTWEEGLGLPGGAQLQYLQRFFTQVVRDWWQFTPWPPFSNRVFVTHAPMSTAFVLYSRPWREPCGQKQEALVNLNVSTITTKKWGAMWFDPRTGDINGTFSLTTNSTGILSVPPREGTSCMLDWVVLIQPASVVLDKGEDASIKAPDAL